MGFDCVRGHWKVVKGDEEVFQSLSKRERRELERGCVKDVVKC